MQEKTVKAGLLAIGILLVASTYKLLELYGTVQALVVTVVGAAFIVASQHLHTERIEITDMRRRLFEVEGTVKELEKEMLEERKN